MRGVGTDNASVTWSKLTTVQWQNVTNTIEFWHEIASYKDASSQNAFQERSDFAMMILVLLWSNADVERAFSMFNNVKTSLRNRLKTNMVNSILTVMGNSAAYFKSIFQPMESPNSEPETPTHDSGLTLMDPRSPATDFTRTPIQVEGIPCKNKTRSKTINPILENSTICNIIAGSPHVDMMKLHRLRLLTDDPRSPSVGVPRTPIQVECVYDSNKVSSYHETNQRIDTKEVLEDNPDEHEVTKSQTIPLDVIAVENQSQTCDLDAEKVTLARCNKKNEDSLPRKLFGTPDSKVCSTQASFKVRPPLRTVSGNENCPQHILRLKQTRGVNQELVRAAGIENTPPDASLTRSKQLSKYNMSSEWDKDCTIVI
ncbi:hypothetical protein ANN_05308 [Periplaneta americana]|uniref:HAT C-terminal dimerisation domain-containing protein n=1 Tax=Periplaneta americana TaxID=6978 RepID=A0ABQ8TAW9_PERAM|nr:hypothetical protein ANN_05308 [Periplaneta americana]